MVMESELGPIYVPKSNAPQRSADVGTQVFVSWRIEDFPNGVSPSGKAANTPPTAPTTAGSVDHRRPAPLSYKMPYLVGNRDDLRVADRVGGEIVNHHPPLQQRNGDCVSIENCASTSVRGLRLMSSGSNWLCSSRST